MRRGKAQEFSGRVLTREIPARELSLQPVAAGAAYIGTRPSPQSRKRVCERIRELTDRRGTSRETAEMVTELNRIRRGWGNCVSLGPVSKDSRAGGYAYPGSAPPVVAKETQGGWESDASRMSTSMGNPVCSGWSRYHATS